MPLPRGRFSDNVLLPRPLEGPLLEDGIRPIALAARCPVDGYLSHWRRDTPLAFDFAVTSGLRDIPAAISDASSAVMKHVVLKRNHLSTGRRCVEHGAFVQMVVEACGGS